MREQEKRLLRIIDNMAKEIEQLKEEVQELTVYHNVTIEFYEKEIESIKIPRRFKIKKRGA